MCIRDRLYTENLLKEMKVPGAPVEDVFKRVRLAVRRASEGAQIPWESTSLEGDFAFVGGSGRDPSREQKEFEADLATWNMLREATTPEPLEDFIRQRPSGKFAELAQYRLDLVPVSYTHLDVYKRQGSTSKSRSLRSVSFPCRTEPNTRGFAAWWAATISRIFWRFCSRSLDGVTDSLIPV